MAHNSNNSRDRDHNTGSGGIAGGPRPPTIPSPYDPSQHFPRTSYSPVRDPRDWNRLPPPGHTLSSLAGEPAFGNRFRSDNNAWRPLAALPLPHPINLQPMPPNVDYLHHWNRPAFLRPDVLERSDESEARQEDPGRQHRMFGTVDSMRNCEQAVHQHFEESFRVAQQKGVWRAPVKDEAEKPHRLSIVGSVRQPMPSSPQIKTFENHPQKPRLDQNSPRIQSGRAPPLPIMIPPRMTLPFSHTSDNNFMYHNDRAREIISPPVVNDRAHFSSTNHAAKASPVQPYVSGPVHRIKVSSPAPPQIYGKPGIPTYGSPSSRNFESMNEASPLSLISKVSTRPSETPPLMSAYKGHQTPPLKTAAHYMFNQAAVPSRCFSATPTPPSQNSATVTQINEYQTQPLDLGGKRKSNSEPLCLNFKKVRSEFRPEQEVNKAYYSPAPSIEPSPVPDQTTRFFNKPMSGTLNLSKEREHSRTPVLGLVKDGMPFIPIFFEQPSATIQRIPPPLIVHAQEIVKNRTNDSVSPKPISTEPDVKPEVMKPDSEARSSPIEKSLVLSVETSRNSSSSSYSVHKLKKAWLERLTGEDVKVSSDTSLSTVSPISKPNAVAKKDVEHPPNAALTVATSISKAVSPALVESTNPQVPGMIHDGHRSPVEVNRIPHMRKKAALRARSMAGLTNGHDSRTREHSSSDSDRGKVPAKRPRPKGRRRPLKERKEKACTNNASFPQADQCTSTPACVCGCNKRHEHKNYNCDGRVAEESESTKDSDESGDPDHKTRPFKSYSGQDSPSPLPSSEYSSPCKTNTKGRKSAGQSPVRPSERKKADPLKRLHTNLLKKTGQSFLQDGPCNEVAPKLGKCRECRWSPNNRSRKQSNIFCRFYAFRKLRYTKNGVIAIAGFSDPINDPSEEDTNLWLPSISDVTLSLELDMAKFLITQVGDQFCEIIQQEKEALQLNTFQSEKSTAWKRVVQGVREMCDVCDTTLFNYHWACGKCGFVVCISCYKSRKQGTLKVLEEPGKDRDNFQWLLCSNRQGHEDDKLMLTQAIAGDALNQMTIQLHRIRAKSKIPQECQCEYAKKYLCVKLNDEVKSDLNGLKPPKEEHPLSNAVKPDEAGIENILASTSPISDNNNDEKIICKESRISKPSELEEDGDEGHSTLRELLIRPSSRKDPDSPLCKQNGSSTEIQKVCDSDSVTKASVVALNSGSSPSSIVNDVCDNDLSNFVRLNPTGHQRKRSVLVMSVSESSKLYASVPHSWLCDGKVLHLHEPHNEGNYNIFREVWKQGQPTIVSNVTTKLDTSLWNAESFSKDFDGLKTDLTDFLTGNLISDQPAKKFWDGFENISARLKNENGEAMLLKLRDSTYEEDFSESHPSRFKDFLTAVPLSDYTHRTGRLNLAARLPENFVRPDLGPKMHLAYGSGLNMDKGTTNLHLDMSDVVNVLVHVGILKDSDGTSHNEDVLKAINQSDCDELTTKRVTCEGKLAGALWHIYSSRDADKIRDFLNKVSSERRKPHESHHDPLKVDEWYLDATLRKRLVEEYNVVGYPIIQCLGDAIFIPAGAPNQVRNLKSCVNVAVDFVSPESVSHCFQLTQEFRGLSTKQAVCEDKLQIKSIIYHGVKDAISVLTCSLADESCMKGETKSEESCSNASDIIN